MHRAKAEETSRIRHNIYSILNNNSPGGYFLENFALLFTVLVRYSFGFEWGTHSFLNSNKMDKTFFWKHRTVKRFSQHGVFLFYDYEVPQ